MKLSRRETFKGLSSLAFLPFFNSMKIHAEGKEDALPKRFVFVVKSSGLEKFNMVPDGLANHFVNDKAILIALLVLFVLFLHADFIFFLDETQRIVVERC